MFEFGSIGMQQRQTGWPLQSRCRPHRNTDSYTTIQNFPTELPHDSYDLDEHPPSSSVRCLSSNRPRVPNDTKSRSKGSQFWMELSMMDLDVNTTPPATISMRVKVTPSPFSFVISLFFSPQPQRFFLIRHY
jgi:hypothetical protein